MSFGALTLAFIDLPDYDLSHFYDLIGKILQNEEKSIFTTGFDIIGHIARRHYWVSHFLPIGDHW